MVYGAGTASVPDTLTPLWQAGIRLIPYPQSVVPGSGEFVLPGAFTVSVEKNASS